MEPASPRANARSVTFAKVVLGLSALAFGGIGAGFLVAPHLLAARIDLTLHSTTAAADVRAVYGGLQLSLAVLLAACALRPTWLVPGLVLQLCTFAGLFLARCGSLAVDGAPSAFGLALQGAEAVGLSCGALALVRTRGALHSSS